MKIRRKPASARREEVIKVMVTSEQKRLFAGTAASVGIDLSNWLRMIALREVKRGEVP